MRHANLLIAFAGAAVGLSAGARAQWLFGNGPVVTTPTGACLPPGMAASETQPGNVVIGFGDSALAGERLADDFTVTDAAGWTVTGVEILAYQTGSTGFTSPITGGNVQIWNGRPGDPGATVVAGDTATNRLVDWVFAGVDRYAGGQCATTRPLWRIILSLPANLAPGTYWIDIQLSGSPLLIGPLVPPTTYTGFRGPQPPHAPGNARKFTSGVWIDATDPATGGVPQDIPFAVRGWVDGTPTGVCCMTGNTCWMGNQAGCTAAGGVYTGDGTVCANTDCPLPGACCLPDLTCQMLTQSRCSALSGVFHANDSCGSANCGPASGACCLLDGSCVLQTNSACTGLGGIYRGDNSACGAQPCPVSVVQTYTPAITIPDGGAVNGTAGASAVATLNVPNQGYITDLDVDFVISHTWQGDLAVRLQAPGGDVLELVGRPGVIPPKYAPGTTSTSGFGADNYGTAALPFIADDSAASVYDNATGYPGPPPGTASATDNASGRWRPVQPLSGFTGLQAQGTWRLVVTDYSALDVGSISRFGLHFTTHACYANCDTSSSTPFLNVNDFVCFQAAFAAGSAGANCDGSTNPPILNVNDFVCFQSAFAGGCSAP